MRLVDTNVFIYAHGKEHPNKSPSRALIYLIQSHAGDYNIDVEVLQEVPEELRARTDTRGEASLRGHLKAEGDEQTGSQSYVPPDPNDDKALHTALDLIRGIQKNSAYPPNPKTAVLN